MKQHLTWAACALAIALAFSPVAVTRTISASAIDGQDVAITIITDPTGGSPKLAVADFALSGSDADLRTAAQTTAQVLWKDLEFEEEFTMVDRQLGASVPIAASVEAVAFEQWAERGADYVVIAQASRAGAGMTIDMHLVDVKGRKLVDRASRRYSGCFVADPRRCAHYIADDLHWRLRAVRGVAQSRVTFASDRDGERLTGVVPRGVKEIYLGDYDGEHQVKLTANRSLNLSASLSPDGQWLAYVSYRSGYNDIYVQPVYRAGTPSRPARGTDEIKNHYPMFSPDGSKIAFASGRTGDQEIYVVDRDGKSPAHRLTNSRGDDIAPTWAPTGAQIAFVSDRSSPNTPLLFMMSADGIGGARLLYDKRADRPSWSPTGTLIAFTCGTQSGYDICVYDLASNQVRNVTQGPGTNEQPVFAPNGRHILFVTTRWGKRQLAIVNIKGTVVRQITKAGNNDWPGWSAARTQ